MGGWASPWLSLLGGLLDRQQSQQFNREGLARADAASQRIYDIGDKFEISDVFGRSGMYNYGPKFFGGIYDQMLSGMPDLSSIYDESRDMQDVAGSDISGDIDAARGRLGSLDKDMSGLFLRGRGDVGNYIGQAMDAAKGLEGQMLTPGGLFAGLDLPEEADFTDRLNANLQGIAAQSAGRESQQRGSTVARAIASGQGLEGAQTALAGAGWQEAQQRALQSGGAQAEGERSLDEFQRFRGGLQAQLGSTEAQINAALAGQAAGIRGSAAQTGAGLLGGLAGQEAQGRLGSAGLQDNFLNQLLAVRGQDIGTQQFNQAQREQNALNRVNTAGADFSNYANTQQSRVGAIMNSIAQRLQGLGLSANTQLGAATGGGSIMAGFSPLMFQWSPLVSQMQQMYQASNPPNQKSGFSLSFLGTGGGMSCLDVGTAVETPEGMRPLWLVSVGSMVRAADGRFRKVVKKDQGVNPKGTQYWGLLKGQLPILGTGCHVVDGVRLDEHPDRIPAHVWVSADIMLEENADYVANHVFVVQSSIGRVEQEAQARNERAVT